MAKTTACSQDKMAFDSILLTIDPYLIWFYRLTGYSLVDFFIGTFVLAWITLLLGEMTISLSFLVVRDRINRVNERMDRYQTLSMEALERGDQQAYQAANKVANDEFGRSFFMQIALSAAFLWPIFFALEWMGLRFTDVEFELLFCPRSMGFTGIFILMYALAYVIFRNIKHRLPYFRYVKNVIDSHGQTDLNRQSGAPISKS